MPWVFQHDGIDSFPAGNNRAATVVSVDKHAARRDHGARVGVPLAKGNPFGKYGDPCLAQRALLWGGVIKPPLCLGGGNFFGVNFHDQTGMSQRAKGGLSSIGIVPPTARLGTGTGTGRSGAS